MPRPFPGGQQPDEAAALPGARALSPKKEKAPLRGGRDAFRELLGEKTAFYPPVGCLKPGRPTVGKAVAARLI
jgi:hypothetical protein